MPEFREAAIRYAHSQHDRYLEDLVQLVSIPSISTDPEHTQDMSRAAQWIADHLRSIGMQQIQILPTAGHPVVYAEYKAPALSSTTLLVYGHYDVQPPDPLDLWNTSPFQPVRQEENLSGRGVSDMKGQVMASLNAIEAVIKTGGIPVNLKLLFEGEEEIGSPSLEGFMRSHSDLLSCSLALNPDAGMIAKDIPTIVYGLRGLAYFELRVYGPSHDLHSGIYGGVIHNPAIALCELIAGMHDAQGRITLPGYYDSVLPLDPAERQELTQLPVDEQYYRDQTGAAILYGESGYTPAERVGARPTLDVNGIYSGFIKEGSKTVIPARAMAKISMRLVPNQHPDEVHRQLLAYLQAKAPRTIRWELTQLAGEPASTTARDQPAVEALRDGLERVWGIPPVFKREGGSIPVVGLMQEILHADSVLTGFGLPDDNLHAPNEKLHLPTWYKGIDALIHFFYNLTPA